MNDDEVRRWAREWIEDDLPNDAELAEAVRMKLSDESLAFTAPSNSCEA